MVTQPMKEAGVIPGDLVKTPRGDLALVVNVEEMRDKKNYRSPWDKFHDETYVPLMTVTAHRYDGWMPSTIKKI